MALTMQNLQYHACIVISPIIFKIIPLQLLERGLSFFFIDLNVNFEPLFGPQYCLRDTILTIQNSQNIYMYKLGVNISIPGAMGFEKKIFKFV